jgi:hypothetical protein
MRPLLSTKVPVEALEKVIKLLPLISSIRLLFAAKFKSKDGDGMGRVIETLLPRLSQALSLSTTSERLFVATSPGSVIIVPPN